MVCFVSMIQEFSDAVKRRPSTPHLYYNKTANSLDSTGSPASTVHSLERLLDVECLCSPSSEHQLPGKADWQTDSALWAVLSQSARNFVSFRSALSGYRAVVKAEKSDCVTWLYYRSAYNSVVSRTVQYRFEQRRNNRVGRVQGRLSLSTLATNAPKTFFLGGGNFIKSLTLSFNIQKCEFCAQT